ncbi:MAG TPA: 2-amino-4-hydroxy-6-hydroxymethyldihydropteridine diphosphokinase [bacterium]|nr:2-amino-4-hydroxy-6-hydroxymethyldihydropteridine diphosphokinase [bacterium]
MVKVYIALGSNRGNRSRHVTNALRKIQKHVFINRISSFILSRPAENAMGGTFLNGVLEGKTELSPRKLILFLHEIEKNEGRIFPHVRGDEREIDLDIIFYGNRVIKSKALVVPHPRYMERDFVIIPISEIAPLFRDPETGKQMKDMRSQEVIIK